MKTKIGALEVETDKAGAPETDPKTTVTKKTDDKLNQTVTVESSNFAFKSKTDSKIKVEFSGGQGTVKYRLKKGDGTTIGDNLRTIPADKEIVLTEDDLTAIGNSNGTPTKITLEFWDEADGFTQGTDSSCATVDITTLFDALDTEAPKVVILPFHWNGENDNSLYENKRANGHVEIAKINSLGNDHSSVSGKVTLRGFAYDNVKIDSIKAELPGKTLTAALSGSGPTWTAGTMSGDGAVLTVERIDADYLGYYVKWTLNWDTEKTTVGLAQDIKVTANDGATTFAEAGVTTAKTTGVTRSGKKSAENAVFANKKPGQFVVFTKGEMQYLTRIRSVTGNTATLEDDIPIEADEVYMYAYTANEPKTTVNVVPYITDVETGLKSADGGFTGSFSRASTGEYSVRAGETIKVKGFNLSGGTVMLGTASLGSNLNSVAIASSHASGELSVQVGGRASINNTVDVSKPYNIEANNVNNDILTANRKLFVWKTVELINNAALESPQFVMDKHSNYYISYGNLKTIKDPASPSSSERYMRLSSNINGTPNDKWEFCYSKFHNTVIGYDDSGKPYLGATNTDRASNSTAFTLFFQKPNFTYAYSEGDNKRRLENSDNKLREVYDVNRVQIPKMAIRGGGTSSDPAKLAVVYFDKNVQNDTQVKFRYGTVEGENTITGGIKYNVSPGGSSAKPTNSGSAEGYEIVAKSTSGFASGQYAAVGLTSTGRAIVVWYDAKGSRLVYSYRDMGTSYMEPKEDDNDRKTTKTMPLLSTAVLRCM